MSLRNQIRQLRRAASAHLQTLRLKDGTEVRYSMDDMLGALSAQLRGTNHPLLPSAGQADPSSSSMALLIQKLEASQKRKGRQDSSPGATVAPLSEKEEKE